MFAKKNKLKFLIEIKDMKNCRNRQKYHHNHRVNTLTFQSTRFTYKFFDDVISFWSQHNETKHFISIL